MPFLFWVSFSSHWSAKRLVGLLPLVDEIREKLSKLTFGETVKSHLTVAYKDLAAVQPSAATHDLMRHS